MKFLAVGCGLNEITPLANSSGTSHLSPDGGSVTRAAVHRLAADGYDSLADQTNIYQSKKGYFFIRLLAISPPYTEQRSYHHHARLRQRGHANPQCFGDAARLEKRPDFRCATRNASAARRYAPSQHGRHRTPKQLARNAKKLRKTFAFVADRTGTELLGVFSNVLGKFDRCDISRIGREEDPF